LTATCSSAIDGECAVAFLFQKCSRECATILVLCYTYVAYLVKRVSIFLRIPVKLTITAAYIVNTLRVIEGCLMCREGIVPQSLALFDSMDMYHQKTTQTDYEIDKLTAGEK
jgi:hypothetical protein